MILLMIYIDKMVNWDWDVKEMRTGRMKIVIQEAAVLAKRKGNRAVNRPKSRIRQRIRKKGPRVFRRNQRGEDEEREGRTNED